MAYVGAPIRRREDTRLTTGRGSYADDVAPANALFAAFVRSPYAHARIRSVDTSQAARLPGVRWALSGQDLALGDHNLFLLGVPLPPNHPDRHIAPWRPLAQDVARYVGEPVAVVVAESPSLAADAAGLVDVAYEPLPSLADPARALDPDAPLLYPEFGTNLAFRYALGSAADDVDAALRDSDHVVTAHISQMRLAAMALEPRATVAQYDPYTDGLVVWASTQGPHQHQHHIAEVLGIPEHRVRVLSRDVGGGFGLKNHLYGDEAAVIYLAWKHHCTIRWAETRAESFQAMSHGRGLSATVSLGVRRDGRFQAIRVEILADMGAVVLGEGGIPPISFSGSITGPYDIPLAQARTTAVYTNRAPTAPYRGAGRPEATYTLERAVDLAARATGLDPAEVRRRNFIPPDRFPFTTAVQAVYDSGNYALALDKALATVDYPAARREQEQARSDGRLLGIGLCTFVESSVPVGWESGTVRVDRGGKVTLLTGSSPHGQGHQTTFAQVVADVLSVPMENVEVLHGDTAAVPVGVGTFGSRSMALGGSSARNAAVRVRDKMQRIAAHLLEASPEDVELAEGVFRVAGAPSRGVPFAGVAAAAYAAVSLPPGMSPGLEETEFFRQDQMSYPFGAHVAVVEVQRETGEISLLRYVAVDDCGTVINPLLVEGQVHGGVAQGLGQALLEQVIYDDQGQLASGTLMDYAVPRASTMPRIELFSTVTPSPNNPLGVKGVGEAGTVAGTSAVANAVLDALAPLGVENVDVPLTSEKVWRAIQTAAAR